MAKVLVAAARVRLRISIAMVIALFLPLAPAAAQTTVTLSTPGTHINADLTIQGGTAATQDFSNSDILASKVSSEAYTRRILIKIDTQNYVPANATIISARLYLVLKSAQSTESRPFTAYYVTKSFVRAEANWLYFRTGQPWSSRGGDLGESFGTTYVGGGAGTAYQFDLTRLVQRTVNGDFGSRYTRLALVDTGGASGANYKEFHSTRAADSAVRPRLVITYTTGSSTGATTPPPPSPAPAPSTTLRVMQWNVRKTKGTDGVCNPDRIATTIAAQNPDIVGLNEVNFFSGECAWTFDMGEKLRSLVEQKTGITWYKQNVNVYGGTSGYGNVLLSRYPPATSSTTLLSYSRGVAQMGIYVNGRIVNVFSTHMEYYDASWRTRQITEAVTWINGFSGPRIVLGDFNTWDWATDYRIIATPYQDAWPAAVGAGISSAYNGTGTTQTNSGTSRFDYVFFTRAAELSLRSMVVPDTRVGGVFPSDHDPVVAVFSVN